MTRTPEKMRVLAFLLCAILIFLSGQSAVISEEADIEIGRPQMAETPTLISTKSPIVILPEIPTVEQKDMSTDNSPEAEAVEPAGSSYDVAILLDERTMVKGEVTRKIPVLYYTLTFAQNGYYQFVSGGRLAIKVTLRDANRKRVAVFAPNLKNEDGREPKYFEYTIAIKKDTRYYLTAESNVPGRSGAFTLRYKKASAPEAGFVVEPVTKPRTEPAPETTPETIKEPKLESAPVPIPELIPEPTIKPRLKPSKEPAAIPPTTHENDPAVEPKTEPEDTSISEPAEKPLLDSRPAPTGKIVSVKTLPGKKVPGGILAKGITPYPESTHPYTDNKMIDWFYYEPDAIGYQVTFSIKTSVENGYDKIYVLDEIKYPLLFTAGSATYSYFTGNELAGMTLTIKEPGFYIRLDADNINSDYGFMITSIIPIYPEDTGAVIYTCEQSGTNASRLTWNKVSGADGYRVFYKTSLSGIYTYSKSSLATYTNVTGLTAGQTYWFRIQPYYVVDSAKRYMSYSSDMSVKIMSTPSITSVQATGGSTALIQWEAIEGASGYVLYRASAAAGTYIYIKTVQTNQAYDSSLSCNTNYYYKIKAFRVYSTKVYSVFSAPSQVVRIDTPVIQSVQQSTASSARVIWNPVSGAGGYQICRATGMGGTYTYLNTLLGTTYTSNNLTPGQTYFYKVRCFYSTEGSRKYSAYSEIMSISILETPSITSASPSGSNSAYVQWEAADYADGYTLYRAPSGSATYEYLVTVPSLDYYDNNLTAGTTYYYKVCAYRLYGSTAVYSSLSSAVPVTISSATETVYRACLIGQDNYIYSSMLHGTYDTSHMKNMLNNLSMGGKTYQVSRYSDCTGAQIQSAISAAFSGAKSNDVSLFFYSGHGVADTTSYAGALCGIDVGNGTISGYVTPTRLKNALNAVPGTVIVILDSCGSGSYIYRKDGTAEIIDVSKAGAAAFNGAITSAFSGYTIKTGELITSKFIVLTACAYNSNSYESSSNGIYYGLFTKELCNGGGYNVLSGSRVNLYADSNSDSIVTLAEAYAYVYNNTNTSMQVVQVYPGSSTYTLFKR